MEYPGRDSGTQMAKHLACGLLAATIALVSTSAGIAAAPDLVGYWRLDENTGTTAADSSGFGNMGTLSGGASWAAGTFESGVVFDGSTGRIVVPSGLWFEAPSVTVGAWVEHFERRVSTSTSSPRGRRAATRPPTASTQARPRVSSSTYLPKRAWSSPARRTPELQSGMVNGTTWPERSTARGCGSTSTACRSGRARR